jgi:hypothetical protein
MNILTRVATPTGYLYGDFDARQLRAIAKEVGRNSFFAPETNYAFTQRVVEALIELDYLDCEPPKARFVPASREDHELGYN